MLCGDTAVVVARRLELAFLWRWRRSCRDVRDAVDGDPVLWLRHTTAAFRLWRADIGRVVLVPVLRERLDDLTTEAVAVRCDGGSLDQAARQVGRAADGPAIGGTDAAALVRRAIHQGIATSQTVPWMFIRGRSTLLALCDPGTVLQLGRLGGRARITNLEHVAATCAELERQLTRALRDGRARERAQTSPRPDVALGATRALRNRLGEVAGRLSRVARAVAVGPIRRSAELSDGPERVPELGEVPAARPVEHDAQNSRRVRVPPDELE